MPLLYRDPYLRAWHEKEFGPPKPKPFRQSFGESLPMYFAVATVALLCLLAVTGNLYFWLPLVLVAVLFVLYARSRYWNVDERDWHRESRKARKRRRKAERNSEPIVPKRIATFLVLLLAFQLFLSVQSPAEGTRAPNNGLVAYWDFNEGSGKILRDVSGNGHNGAISGEPKWDPGISGKAIYFDGFDDFVTIDSTADLNFGTGDFSYSLWLKLQSIPPKWSQLLCKRVPSGEDYEVQLSASGQVEFVFGNPVTGYSRTLSNTILKVDTWYMVTVVRGSGEASLYINAKFDNTLKAPQNITNNNELTVGRDNYADENFKGTLDELRIWNRALTPEEIVDRYNENIKPDLAISADDIYFSNQSPTANSEITITAVVHNKGNGEARESIIQFLDGNNQIGKNGTLPVIKPGEAAKYTIRWIAFPGGGHNITVKVDPDGLIVEMDEANNKAMKSIRVQPQPPQKYAPDLTLNLNDITFSVPNPMENETVLISAKILNIGTANATNAVFRVLDGTNIIDNDIVISAIRYSGSYPVSINWKAAPAGAHNLTFSVDPDNRIDEVEEKNNVATKLINVSAPLAPVKKPDLFIGVSDITFSTSPPVDGTIIEISVTVRNLGAGPASSLLVRFLDGTAPIGTDQPIPSLLPDGGMAQVSTKWTATPAALHDIIAWADPASTVDESNESNNRAGRSILINPNIVNVNHPPKFTSSPPSIATAGVVLSYQVTASDIDNDKLVLSLVSKPESTMSFDPLSAMFSWTPSVSQAGDHRLVLNCSDGRGGIAEQSFIVHVDILKPLCAITTPAANQSVSGSLVILGNAFRGATALRVVQVRLDGGAWKDANGTSAWNLPIDTMKLGNGIHTVEARSFDTIAESDTVSVRFSINNVEYGVTRGEFPLCFAAITLAFILSAARLIYIRHRRNSQMPPVR